MKATELMIGDWVYASKDEHTALKVMTINGNTADCIWDVNNECDMNIDEFEPIPLTPEIIRENGFKDTWPGYFEEDEHGMLELHYDRRKGQILWSINFCEYEIIPLDYVHELQHALKLCGIEKEITL